MKGRGGRRAGGNVGFIGPTETVMIPPHGGQERDASPSLIREALRDSLIEIRPGSRKGSLTSLFLIAYAHAADPLSSPCV